MNHRLNKNFGHRVMRLIIIAALALGASSTMVQCAKRGRPSGGIKDSIPPVLIKSLPNNLSTKFKGNEFSLMFDEFVQLKDVGEQLVISPPLKYPVVIKPTLRATKSLEVRINDTLYDNTTYTFNFGQSIVDFNEGNPAINFNYTFSTGAYIDSLSFSGIIEDAFLNKPDNFVSVMLYSADSTYNDSIIYKQPPRYITNTLDSLTTFTLNYLNEGKYHIVALKDENKNNRFDPLFEKIGFLTEPIQVPSEQKPRLKLFREIAPARVLSAKLESPNKILFGYQGLIEDLDITLETPIDDEFKYLYQKIPQKDSVYFWFNNSKIEGLTFTARHQEKGVRDTFQIKTRKMVPDSLVLSLQDRRNIPPREPLMIHSSTPIMGVNKANIQILDKDTLLVNFNPSLDTLNHALKLDFPIEPNQNYRIQLFPGAITDLMNNSNDSIQFRLSTENIEAFGTAHILVEQNINSDQIIVELLDKEQNPVRSMVGDRTKKFTFDFMDPGTYYLRIIGDKNRNGQWDTGSFLKKLLPEEVFFYPEALQIRSNWEVEYKF